MPSLTELLKPLSEQGEQPDATPKDGKAELDPVGRDLMNALLGHFRPKFEDEPQKEE